MKIIKKLILSMIILISFSNIFVYAIDIPITLNSDTSNTNLDIWNKKENNAIVNEHLQFIKDGDNSLFNITTWWEKWISQTLINIAKDLKNIFFIVAWLYFLIMVIKLIFDDNVEEEVWKFKKWVIWISVWIIMTQISYSFIETLYNQNVTEWLAKQFIDNIIYPLIKLIQTCASFFFIGIAIYAFFRMITANWNEEKVKTWRMSIFYSIVWFVIIKISKAIVETIYWKVDCNNMNLWFIEFSNTDCVIRENLTWSVKILADVINWANSFIFIVILIFIMYTWFQVIFSIWNEEVLKKAKKSILYIILWLALLFINYLILTFFIIPESVI